MNIHFKFQLMQSETFFLMLSFHFLCALHTFIQKLHTHTYIFIGCMHTWTQVHIEADPIRIVEFIVLIKFCMMEISDKQTTQLFACCIVVSDARTCHPQNGTQSEAMCNYTTPIFYLSPLHPPPPPPPPSPLPLPLPPHLPFFLSNIHIALP